jgi:hypothetical protein
MNLYYTSQEHRKEFATRLNLDSTKEMPFELRGFKALDLRNALDDYFLTKSDLEKIASAKSMSQVISNPKILENLFLGKTPEELSAMASDETLDDQVQDMVALTQFFVANQELIEKSNGIEDKEAQKAIADKALDSGIKVQRAMFTLLSQNPDLLKLINNFDLEEDQNKDYLKKKLRGFYISALSACQKVYNIPENIFQDLNSNEFDMLLDCANLENHWGFGFFTKI